MDDDVHPFRLLAVYVLPLDIRTAKDFDTHET